MTQASAITTVHLAARSRRRPAAVPARTGRSRFPGCRSLEGDSCGRPASRCRRPPRSELRRGPRRSLPLVGDTSAGASRRLALRELLHPAEEGGVRLLRSFAPGHPFLVASGEEVLVPPRRDLAHLRE